MTTRPQRALETPNDAVARLQTELDELRSKIQGERYRRRWLYIHDVFNTSTRRAAIYYQGESVFFRRENINPEPGIMGVAQGGELIFVPGLAALRYIDEATENILGEIFFNAEGEAKIVARDMANPAFEKGVLHITQDGDTTLFASNQIWVQSINNININGGDITWITAETDLNLLSNGSVFIRSNDNGSDISQIAMFGNGETNIIRNGADRGSLVGQKDIQASIDSLHNLVYNVTKPFVINHPDDPNRLLVHGCTESPMAGVEYWGEAEIFGGEAKVELPSYFESLTLIENRQVQVTPIDELCMVATSRIEGGQFTIKCSGPDGTKVSWMVKAERKGAAGFDVEPLKSEVTVRGDGPYRYLVKR